jgi:hypothetical protein
MHEWQHRWSGVTRSAVNNERPLATTAATQINWTHLAKFNLVMAQTNLLPLIRSVQVCLLVCHRAYIRVWGRSHTLPFTNTIYHHHHHHHHHQIYPLVPQTSSLSLIILRTSAARTCAYQNDHTTIIDIKNIYSRLIKDCCARNLRSLWIFTMHGGWRLAGAGEVWGEEATYSRFVGRGRSFSQVSLCSLRFVLSYLETDNKFHLLADKHHRQNVRQLLSGLRTKRLLTWWKFPIRRLLRRAYGCFLFVPGVLLLPSLFLSLSFKFVFVVLIGINCYYFFSSRCIVGSKLAGITCFYKEYILDGV